MAGHSGEPTGTGRLPCRGVRITLIVNTTASAVTPRARVVIQKALGADHEVEVVETARRGHASRIARAAAVAGADVVAVMAGDGTLNEAADGLAGTQTALAPLPGGSTNVYARSLGIADDPVEATGQLLSALGRRSLRRIGLGVVDGRRFLFHTGVGFDAAVVAQVERRAALKRYAPHPLFIASAFVTWFRHYDHTQPHFAVELPGGEVVEDCYLAIVSKIDPYTYLGRRPIRVAPGAGLDRPLALTAFRTLAIGTILPALASALRGGRYLARHPAIVQRAGLEQLTVRGHRPVPYQADGDYLGEAERLQFRHEPEALTIVVP